jgi:hypothetical protein
MREGWKSLTYKYHHSFTFNSESLIIQHGTKVIHDRGSLLWNQTLVGSRLQVVICASIWYSFCVFLNGIYVFSHYINVISMGHLLEDCNTNHQSKFFLDQKHCTVCDNLSGMLGTWGLPDRGFSGIWIARPKMYTKHKNKYKKIINKYL